MITVVIQYAGSYYEFCIALMVSTLALYSLHVIIFNDVHLCQKNEGICWKAVFGYYVRCPPLICFLSTDIDRLEDAVRTSQGHDQCRQLLLVASQICQILAPRHPKLTEDPKAVGTVLIWKKWPTAKEDAQRTGKESNYRNFRRWCGSNRCRDCIIIELRSERYSSD